MGMYDDSYDDGSDGDDSGVEFYDDSGTPTTTQNGGNGLMGAVVIVGFALAILWVTGSLVFKGSNQS